MKKLLWLIVMIVTIYILLIFKAPNITTKIEKTIGFSGFTDFVTGTKSNLDKTYTNIPTTGEAYSGIIDIKNNIVDGLNTTKNKIDDVRAAAVSAEKKFNKATETYNNAKKYIDTTNQKLQNIQKTVKNVTKTISNTNSGTTNTINSGIIK